jgi:LysR family nitrogen assimilation transcriptional regulator
VQALEAAFGAQLLIRSRQGIMLTEQGRALYHHAKLILRQYAAAKREIKIATQEVAGSVFIAMPGSLNIVLAEKLISMARERFPRVTLVMSEGLAGALMDEYMMKQKFDIVLASTVMENRRLDVVPLLAEQMVLFGRKEAIGESAAPITMKALADIPLVLPNATNQLRQDMQRAFDQAGVSPSVVAEVDSTFILRKAAAEGIGATILPVIAVARFGDASHNRREIIEPRLERSIALATFRHQPLSPEAATIKALIIELVTSLVRAGEWPGARLLDSPEVKRGC